MEMVKSKSNSLENVVAYGDKVHDSVDFDWIKKLSDKMQKTVNELAEAIELASNGEYCPENNSVESVNKYRWHDLRKHPDDLPEVFIDYEVEHGKFSDKLLVKTDKYDTLMVAYMNLSTGEWFNELNEDECFHEEYGNVVKWKYIDYE